MGRHPRGEAFKAFTVRMNPEDCDRVQEIADILGVSKNSFMVKVTMREVEKIGKDRRLHDLQSFKREYAGD